MPGFECRSPICCSGIGADGRILRRSGLNKRITDTSTDLPTTDSSPAPDTIDHCRHYWKLFRRSRVKRLSTAPAKPCRCRVSGAAVFAEDLDGLGGRQSSEDVPMGMPHRPQKRVVGGYFWLQRGQAMVLGSSGAVAPGLATPPKAPQSAIETRYCHNCHRISRL